MTLNWAYEREEENHRHYSLFDKVTIECRVAQGDEMNEPMLSKMSLIARCFFHNRDIFREYTDHQTITSVREHWFALPLEDRYVTIKR